MKQPPSAPKLLVVIPCLNEERHIGDLLDDLAGQTQQPDAVIVADCSSEDGTVATAERFAGTLPLRVVQSTARWAAAARNTGARAAHGQPYDYVVFIDADMRLPGTFIEHIRGAIRIHPVDFITPAFKSDGRHWADTIGIRQVNALNRRMINRKHQVSGIGGVMVVRKAMHDAVSGFPEGVKQDDAEYVQRLNAAHASAYYAGDVVVTNSSRRLREEGVASWLLGILPEHSRAAKHLGKLLGKDLSVRRYGHYTHKSR